MQASQLDFVGRQIALGTIGAYKQYLSPHKGYSCAHRMLHEGESCSDYVQQMFSTQSFMSALQSSRQRFRDCAAAAQSLRNTNAGFRCIILPCCFPI